MKHLLILMPQFFFNEVAPIIINNLPDLVIEWIDIPNSNYQVDTKVLSRANFILYTGLKINHEMLEAAKNLQFVQKWGSGVDGIDLEFAKKLGVHVANVPGGNATSVAEHCFGLIFTLYKRLCQANESLHNGIWCQEQLIHDGLEELSGKILGLVGFGNIGKAIAHRAIAFEMKVNYYCRHQLDNIHESTLCVKYFDLDRITEASDIIVLALPLSSETTYLYNSSMFQKMKPTAILINISRGGVVKETDLYEALITRKIAGAGLDVFEDESPNLNNPLFHLPNVVVTPHIAGRTRQAIIRITENCVNNIALVARGGLPSNTVTQ